TLLEEGIRPAIVVAAPVGFVGAKEAKERILEYDIPCIVIKGDKGGSTVAVAITNAILNLASEGNDVD
ncbi:MAG: precorrin-8X methylmutase, partial [Candidatus Hydrothermarchaeales archaeon]